MIDLSGVSGLPIKFDAEKVTIYFDDCVNCGNIVKVPLSEMIPILLNKFLKYPELVYSHHCNITNGEGALDKLTYDIITIPYGLLGIEYIRTHVYSSDYAEGKFDCMVEVLTGKLTVVLQKNVESDDPYEFEKTVEEMQLVELSSGQKFPVPTGYLYTFINTETYPVVFSKVSGKNHKEIDYSVLKKEKGLAFYIISKNARIEIVPNPKYKSLSSPKMSNMQEVMQSDKYGCKTFCEESMPLYNLLHTKLNEMANSLRVE